MIKSFPSIIFSTVMLSGVACAKDVACIPRAEMGETLDGDHLYHRDAELKISNMSRIDFDELTITSAEGNRSKIARVEENVYKTDGTGNPYYFITNDAKSIVTELSVHNLTTYVKVLLCK